MKIVQSARLPADQFIESEAYVTDYFYSGPSPGETYSDPIHLNTKGHGSLAQAIYMRLSYSKPFMMRHLNNQANLLQKRDYARLV